MSMEQMDTGRFVFDGCDTVALAKKYGTPLYVMSETNIECRWWFWHSLLGWGGQGKAQGFHGSDDGKAGG